MELFSKEINDAVQTRLDEIMTRDDFAASVEEIYFNLEDRLAENLQNLNEQEKKDLIEDLRVSAKYSAPSNQYTFL